MVEPKFKLILEVDGKETEMKSSFTDSQLDYVAAEMSKPKNKRKYLFGIEFKNVESVRVIKQ